MPNSIYKRIASYSVIASSVMLSNKASAEYIYTNLDPDSTVTEDGATFVLDLNQDGTKDFQFDLISAEYTAGTHGYSIQLGRVKIDAGSNGVYGEVAAPFNHPFLMGFGSSINSGLAFQTWKFNIIGFYYTLSGYYMGDSSGHFLGKTGYAGLQFKINGDWHYGWVHVTVHERGQTYTIHDYAYNDEPNMPIVAGDTTTSISKNELSKTKVYGFGSEVRVQIPPSIIGAKINVYNSVGQLVHNTTLNSTKGNHSINIPSRGMYIVTIESGNSITSKKIILE